MSSNSNQIFSKCQRRSRTVVYTEGTDEDPEGETSSKDEASSEEEATKSITEERRQKTTTRQREEQIELKDEVIYITRNGERFHVSQDFVHMKRYKHHQRVPCELCQGATKGIIEGTVSSSSQKANNFVYLSLKDQKYHHEDFPRISKGTKTKDQSAKIVARQRKEKSSKTMKRRRKGLESKTHSE